MFHCFPWDISFLFHTHPAAIFHYFPAHFSLFPLGHFIAISYLPCCDISLFPSPFFIVFFGTFHCYFIPILLRYFIISHPIFLVSLGILLPVTFFIVVSFLPGKH